jgi:hypothetical protein
MFVKEIVKIAFVAALFLPTLSHAAVFEWRQGNNLARLSYVTISPSNVNVTLGTYGHLCTVDSNSNGSTALAYVERQSGTFNKDSVDLTANTAYIVVKTDLGTLNKSVCDNAISQIRNANNGSPYPLSPTFMGMVYFETNSDKDIKCWSTKINIDTSGNSNFLDCDYYFFETQSSGSTSEIQFIPIDNTYSRVASSTCDKLSTTTDCMFYYETATSTVIANVNVRWDLLIYAFGIMLMLMGIQTWYVLTGKLS